MARHANQRALTVNPNRVNANPQPRPAPVKRQKVLDDFEEMDEMEAPQRLGVNFHLILTGQFRAGGGF